MVADGVVRGIRPGRTHVSGDEWCQSAVGLSAVGPFGVGLIPVRWVKSTGVLLRVDFRAVGPGLARGSHLRLPQLHGGSDSVDLGSRCGVVVGAAIVRICFVWRGGGL